MKITWNIVFILTSFFPTLAKADTFTYICNVGENRFHLKYNNTKNYLMWKGVTYRVIDLDQQDFCPRIGFKAQKNDKSFIFCIATQGGAFFKLDGKEITCQQTHFNNELIIKHNNH